MIRPTVEVLFQLVDKITAPLRATTQGLQGFTGSLKRMGDEGVALLSNKFLQGFGLVGIWAGLNKAFDAADLFRVALQKLEGTAKITGTPLAALQGLADTAAEKFKLSKTASADLSVEMVKLAAKAGDVGKAGPAMQAFLDIGAARGLSASETLKAVQQAILGIDEGTDKLFNANPSVLYQQFAQSIGTTAGKLTDQQKAQALLTAATIDGSKVQGEYANFLNSTAGQAELAANKQQEAYAKIGAALSGFRTVMASTLAWAAEKFSEFVGGIQIIGADIAVFFMRLPVEFKSLIGLFITGVAEMVDKASGIPIIGEKFKGVATSFRETGQRMFKESQQSLADIQTGYEVTVAEIVGVSITGQKRQTEVLKSGTKARKQLSEEEQKAAETATKKSHDNLAALDEKAFKASLVLLSAQEREYQELVRDFQQKMQGMTQEDYDKAAEKLKKAHANLMMAWDGYGKQLVPAVQGPVLKVRDGIVDLESHFSKSTDAIVKKAEEWQKLKDHARDIGAAVSTAAQDILDFATALGISDDKMSGLVHGIGQLGSAVATIATGGPGSLLAGLKQGVSAIAGVVGSIFGKSAQEKAVEEALNKNRESLNRLTEEVGDLNLNLTGQQLSGVEGALKDFFAAGGARSAGWGDQLASALEDRGLSVTDLDQVAKTLGIDIRPGGHLDPDTLRQLMEAIGLTEPTQFGQDYSGRRDQIRSGVRLGTVGDEAAATAELARQISPAFAKAFEGLDLSTAGGKEAGTTAIQQLFARMSSGGLATSELGGLSGSEFLSLLEDLFGLFGDSTSPAGPSAPIASGSAGDFTAVTYAPNPTVPVPTTTVTGVDIMPMLTRIDDNVAAMAIAAGATVDRLDRLLDLAEATAAATGATADAAEATAEAMTDGGFASVVNRELYRIREQTTVNTGGGG